MKISTIFCFLATYMSLIAAFPPPKTCQISDSDPKPDWNSISRATVNLDLAPKERWVALATEYKTEVATMVNEFVVRNIIRICTFLQ